MTRTHGSGTPVVSQLVAAVITILLLLANSSRATANLYTFIILLSTASIVVLYFVGSLAAWRANASIRARSIIVIALGFVVFAAYGTGLEACLWVFALLAAGLVIRAIMHRLNSRAGSNPPAEPIPAAPPGSSA